VRGTDKRGPRGASIFKNGSDVELKYIKFSSQWDGAHTVKYVVKYTTSEGDDLNMFPKGEITPYCNAEIFDLFGPVYGVIIQL